MSITLRTLKGSALTYDEMDRNLSQYYYSSSLHNNGETLRLHFTGSNSLDTPSEDYGPDRYHEIPLLISGSGGITVAGVSRIIAGPGINISSTLPSGQGEVTITSPAGAGALPAGITGSVQFKAGISTFGGDESFFYDSVNKRLGLGTATPDEALHITGDRGRQATVRLATDGGIQQTAKIDFFNGSSKLGSIGKTRPDSAADITKDIFILADGELGSGSSKRSIKVHTQIGEVIKHSVTSDGVGINTTSPNKELTVLTPTDGKGIGIGSNTTINQSEIKPVPSTVVGNLLGGPGIPNSTQGLMIHPPLQNPDGGNIVLGVVDNAAGRSYSGTGTPLPNRVSIASFLANGGLTQNNPIATFLSNQTVGINTNAPSPRVRLDINGQYRGAFTAQANYSNLDFNIYSVIKVTSNSTSKETITLSAVPLAGVRGTLVLQPQANHNLEFSSTWFRTVGGLTMTSGNYYTINFISDGTYFVETSRTGPLT